jgi:hypothetical protein
MGTTFRADARHGGGRARPTEGEYDPQFLELSAADVSRREKPVGASKQKHAADEDNRDPQCVIVITGAYR